MGVDDLDDFEIRGFDKVPGQIAHHGDLGVDEEGFVATDEDQRVAAHALDDAGGPADSAPVDGGRSLGEESGGEWAGQGGAGQRRGGGFGELSAGDGHWGFLLSRAWFGS